MARLFFINDEGFTLLELLVAVAILTIVALTSLSNNSTIISNNSYLQEKTLAHWVAMNKAAELRLEGVWVTGKKEGVAVMADQKWRWIISGKTTPDPDIQLLNIEVRPEAEEEQTPLAALTMYLGKQSGY
jgi:general secretion pathway protein I